jgi:hypothetical protein
MGMERRAASHTEEEEMNQRRKLLNAARRGDTKAISKLFELYQVRVLSGDQLAKVNRTSAYMTPVKPSQAGKSKASGKGTKPTSSKPTKKPDHNTIKKSTKPPVKSHRKHSATSAKPQSRRKHR